MYSGRVRGIETWCACAAAIGLCASACKYDRDALYRGAADADVSATAVLVEGEAGGFRYAAAACRDCVDASCEEEARTCRGSAECVALMDCWFACAPEDSACRYACFEAHPGANPAAAVLWACRVEACPQTCEATATIDAHGPECAACTQARGCAPVQEACAADAQCRGWQACLLEKSGTFRIDDPGLTFPCDAEYPEVAYGFVPDAYLCAWATCSETCSIGANLGCVDQFAWPLPQGTVARLTFFAWHLSVALDRWATPVVNAAVRACEDADDACESPVALGTTDADGKVVLEAPENPFAGYLEVMPPSGIGGLAFYSRPFVNEAVQVDPFFGGAILDFVTSQAPEHVAGRGSIVTMVLDCGRAAVQGTVLSASLVGGAGTTGASPLYVGSAGLDPTLLSTGPTGTGVFVDLDPGWWIVTASVEGLEISRKRVLVRADTFTTLRLEPSPETQ